MRNQDLIPTVVTDANGRVTTVYKRAQVKLSTRSAISHAHPSISELLPLKKDAVRAYKPSPHQEAQRVMNMISWTRRVSPEIAKKLGLDGIYKSTRNVGVYASEVEAYSVASAVRHDDALVLLESNVRSREEAFQFLEDNDLMHLSEDKSEIMDAALRRRLGFQNFMLFMQGNYTNKVDPDLFMDAAEAHDAKGIRDKAAKIPLPRLVLEGEIALSDIKDMTVTKLTSKSVGEATIKELIAINKGERDYTAKQLKRMLDNTGADLFDNEVIELVESIGFNSAYNLRNKKRAYAIYLEIKDKDEYKRNSFKRMDAIQYSEIMTIYRRDRETAQVVLELFEAGADSSEASKALNEGMTVPQVIAVHGQGAPKSISTGWL